MRRAHELGEAAIEEQHMRFASVDAELQTRQQAQDLVRMYLNCMADSDDTISRNAGAMGVGDG